MTTFFEKLYAAATVAIVAVAMIPLLGLIALPVVVLVQNI